MAYELFQHKASQLPSPQITILPGKFAKIALNAHSGDILAKAETRFVYLFWDVATCKIAIRPQGKSDSNTFRLSIPKGKRGGTISATSFLNYIRWNANQPVTVDAKWNEGERILEATLPTQHIDAELKT